jgi:hypothetical protein
VISIVAGAAVIGALVAVVIVVLAK